MELNKLKKKIYLQKKKTIRRNDRTVISFIRNNMSLLFFIKIIRKLINNGILVENEVCMTRFDFITVTCVGNYRMRTRKVSNASLLHVAAVHYVSS